MARAWMSENTVMTSEESCCGSSVDEREYSNDTRGELLRLERG